MNVFMYMYIYIFYVSIYVYLLLLLLRERLCAVASVSLLPRVRCCTSSLRAHTLVAY